LASAAVVTVERVRPRRCDLCGALAEAGDAHRCGHGVACDGEARNPCDECLREAEWRVSDLEGFSAIRRGFFEVEITVHLKVSSAAFRRLVAALATDWE